MVKNKNSSKAEKALLPFSRLLKRSGRLKFNKVYQPKGGSVLITLDIDNPFEPFNLDGWFFHILFAGKSGHHHFLLSMPQAREVQKYLANLISLYESTQKEIHKRKKLKIRAK